MYIYANNKILRIWRLISTTSIGENEGIFSTVKNVLLTCEPSWGDFIYKDLEAKKETWNVSGQRKAAKEMPQ